MSSSSSSGSCSMVRERSPPDATYYFYKTVDVSLHNNCEYPPLLFLKYHPYYGRRDFHLGGCNSSGIKITNVYIVTDNVELKKHNHRRHRRRRPLSRLFRRKRRIKREKTTREEEQSITDVTDSLFSGKCDCGIYDPIDMDNCTDVTTTTLEQIMTKNVEKSQYTKRKNVYVFSFFESIVRICLCILFISSPIVVQGVQIDCCLAENSENGIGCTDDGTFVGGQKYLCVPIVTNDCIYCNKKDDIEISQCSTGCVLAKLRYFCSGRYDPDSGHATFGEPAALAHAAEIAQHPLGESTQLPKLRGSVAD